MRRHDIQDSTGVIIRHPTLGVTLAAGTTVPTDAALGYAPNCIFIDLNATGGVGLFINVGTKASANFDAYNGGLDLTTLLATAAELNRAADVSTRLVAAGATLTLTEAAHEGKIIALDTAAGSVVTLPDITTTNLGGVYRFLVTVTATSNSHVIKASAGTTNEMVGYVIQDSDTATAPNIWWAADNDDTITLNRSTSGLAAQGEYFELVAMAAGHWAVKGYSQASGTEVTPFSATV